MLHPTARRSCTCPALLLLTGGALAPGCGSSRSDGAAPGTQGDASMPMDGGMQGDAPRFDSAGETGVTDSRAEAAPPMACTTPGDCAATQGCVADLCGPCTQSSDCGADETCGAGVCSSPCTSKLQDIVNATPAGATVTIASCVYRELITLSKPIALVARPGAEIRGSDLWTNWTSAPSGTWTNGKVLASPIANNACNCTECDGDTTCQMTGQCYSPATCACAAKANCYLPQQVFFDGAPLTQIATGTPANGQFVVDLQTGAVTLGLGDDPNQNGHVVEVTTRDHWLVAAQPIKGVTIRGFTMRHAASPPQHGALDSTGGACKTTTAWTVQSNHLLYGAGGCLTPNAGDQILDNELAFAGQEGANTSCFDHGLMKGNDIHDNNTESFSSGWEAAGVKGATTVGAVFDGNDVHDNLHGAPGLWSDINCYDTTYSNNTVTGNGGTGIFYEISDTATITGNTVKDNGPSTLCCGSSCSGGGCWFYGGGQILVSASPNVTISGNTTSGAMGIGVLQQYRTDSCTCPSGSPNTACCSPGLCSGTTPYHHVFNISIHDNDITESQTASSGGAPAGLVTDFCNGTCASETTEAGSTCDASSYYGPTIMQYVHNTYHISACDLDDWALEGGGVTWSAWQAGGEDTTGTCGM
jgi:parallel beta-helix repeat protein